MLSVENAGKHSLMDLEKSGTNRCPSTDFAIVLGCGRRSFRMIEFLLLNMAIDYC
jgi:hypothetical protein